MTDPDDNRRRLGSYVAGALEPDERGEVDLHLAGCEACRRELSLLAPLPGLLWRLPPPDNGPFGPPPLSLLATAVRNRRAARRHRLTFAVVALGVAASVAVAVGVTLNDSRSQLPGERTIVLRSASGPARGTAVLDPRPWGTQIELRLAHLPAASGFVAWVQGPQGGSVAGSWGRGHDGRAIVEIASSLPVTSISGLRVATSAGAAVLGA
ncbi:MAG: zf-HC2 domain-containing protein [Acidimicrobiales bacterium]